MQLQKLSTQALLIAALIASLPGCLKLLPGSAAGSNERPPAAVDAARVQVAWQSAFINHMLEHTADGSEAWAVLSYSGWMDFGQHFFIRQKPGPVSYLHVPENFANASLQKPELKGYLPQKQDRGGWTLPPKEWQHFARPQPEPWSAWQSALADFHKLTPLPRQVFDGLEVEYINLKKEAGRIQVIKRLYINTPDEEHGPKHLEVITNFQNLTAKNK